MALRKNHFFLIGFVLLADQISKYLVSNFVQLPVSVLPFLKLSVVMNTGVVFGLLNNFDLRWFLVLFSVGVVVFLFFYSKKQKNSVVLYSIALIIAGALGNAFDRILFGSVVDFIAVGWWPAFNIADAALTVGVAGLLYNAFMSG